MSFISKSPILNHDKIMKHAKILVNIIYIGKQSVKKNYPLGNLVVRFIRQRLYIKYYTYVLGTKRMCENNVSSI